MFGAIFNRPRRHRNGRRLKGLVFARGFVFALCGVSAVARFHNKPPNRGMKLTRANVSIDRSNLGRAAYPLGVLPAT